MKRVSLNLLVGAIVLVLALFVPWALGLWVLGVLDPGVSHLGGGWSILVSIAGWVTILVLFTLMILSYSIGAAIRDDFGE